MEEGSRRTRTGGQRDPNYTGHGLGLGPWVEEGRRREVDRQRPGDSETHGSRDGASRSDADSGLVPGEKKEAGRTRTGGQGDRGTERPRLRGTRTRAWSPGRRREKEGEGRTRTGGRTDRRRDLSCAGHGRGQSGRDGRRKMEKGEPGQGDRQTQRAELRGPRQRPGRPGWKKEAGEGRRREEKGGEGRAGGCGTRGSRDGSLDGGRRRQAAPGGREEEEEEEEERDLESDRGTERET